jgi:hypothetical protein
MQLRRWHGTIDTSFDELDYTATQYFWSRDYVKHSVHIEPRALREATHHDQPRRPNYTFAVTKSTNGGVGRSQ